MTGDPIEEGWEYPAMHRREPRDRYYAALGRFMHRFGAAEEAFAALIKQFVSRELNIQLQDAKADAIVSALTGGMRVAVVRDTIKRLMRVTDVPDLVVTEVNNTFDHLGEIHFFRDRIAHHGATEDPRGNNDGKFVTTNDITVKEVENAEYLVFGV